MLRYMEMKSELLLTGSGSVNNNRSDSEKVNVTSGQTAVCKSDNIDRITGSDKGREISRIYLKKYLRKYSVYALVPTAVVILSLRFRPELRIAYLHVGQGDGIVVQTGEYTYLIDGGSTSRTGIGKYVLEPYLKHEGHGIIDAAIITHEDADHISGVLELFENMPKGGIQIKRLVLPDCAAGCREDHYAELERAAKDNNVPVSYISRGQEIITGTSDLTFSCIGPEKGLVSEGANAHSTILHLRYGSFQTLLTGDVEAEGLESLDKYLKEHQSSYADLTVLKVPHHGSKYTTDKKLLDILKPRLGIISAGRNNRYGHPHREVLDRLTDAGAKYLVTFETGAVTVDVSASKATVRCFIEEKS
jgi:competence protein ComEC